VELARGRLASRSARRRTRNSDRLCGCRLSRPLRRDHDARCRCRLRVSSCPVRHHGRSASRVRPALCDHRNRCVQCSGLRPRLPRSRPSGLVSRLHRSSTFRRKNDVAYHAGGCAPEHRRRPHRAGHDPARPGDPDGGRAQLSRPRSPAAESELGPDAERFSDLFVTGPTPRDRTGSGNRPLRIGAQSPGRRATTAEAHRCRRNAVR
jgi:hypothetical protein